MPDASFFLDIVLCSNLLYLPPVENKIRFSHEALGFKLAAPIKKASVVYN